MAHVSGCQCRICDDVRIQQKKTKIHPKEDHIKFNRSCPPEGTEAFKYVSKEEPSWIVKTMDWVLEKCGVIRNNKNQTTANVQTTQETVPTQKVVSNHMPEPEKPE